MSTSYITAKRSGKSRVRSTVKSVARSLGNIPKLVSRAEIEAEAKVKVLEDLKNQPKGIPPPVTLPSIAITTFRICKDYNEENDYLCDVIKTEMGADLTNTDLKITLGLTSNDIKDLYFTFIRRYMRFLKFRNVVSTQFVNDEYFYIDHCPFIENEQFRNFINFDISLGAVMNRYSSFIELDFEAVENIVDSNGSTRLDKLYQLLYNQVLINAGPYYQYIINLLKIHEEIKEDLIKTINKVQDKLDKNIGYINHIKKGDTISLELRELVLYYINNSGYNYNNKEGLIFNLEIGDNEMKLIEFILEKYNTLCNYNIDSLFETKLVIEDSKEIITQFTEQIKIFDELYSERVSNIENKDERDIIINFIDGVRKYYRDASSSASSSVSGRIPDLVERPSGPVGREAIATGPPLGVPPPLLKEAGPAGPTSTRPKSSRQSVPTRSASAGPSEPRVIKGPVKTNVQKFPIDFLMKQFMLGKDIDE